MRTGDEQISGARTDTRALDGGEWYVVPREWTSIVAPIPQCRFSATDHPIVHRSVLNALRDLGLPVPTLETIPDAGARAAFDAATGTSGWRLRQYQHRGREFIRARRGSLLAFQMRLGKTPTIVASHDLDDGPLIVIGPLATRAVWNRWFALRWPGVEPVNVTGRRYDADKVIGAQIVFAHYDILSSWQSLAAKLRPSMLVFDEAHVLSKAKSRRTQAAVTIATFADRVVAATGTPLWNKPAGLYPMLACLNLGAWGKFGEYATRYCSGRPGSHGLVHDEPSNIEEFAARMRDVMLHLTWNDVADELPPTIRRIIDAPVHENDAYEIEIEAERVRDGSRLRTPIGELARFRRIVGRLKVRPAIDRAVELLTAGESVLVWTWHRDLAQAIAAGINERLAADRPMAAAVDGDTSIKAREIAFEYARNVTPSALVMTMGVGQVGIDLSHASYEIFAELDFTPATVAQAEMRPFSPDRSMTVEYVVLDHVVDRRLAEVLVAKCQTAQRMGVPAAETAIDMLGIAFGLNDEGDMDRLMQAVLGTDHAE